MAKKIKRQLGEDLTIHCACLIHDTLYDFEYVHRLYRSLCRNLTPEVVLHVYTESNRDVPAPYIKHSLMEWPGVRGAKQSWWYKVQLFNDELFSGKLLYFDLDTVIVSNIDWLWQQKHADDFWTIRDFKWLFRQSRVSMNSSVMRFDTHRYSYIYKEFDFTQVAGIGVRRWHGDQDYIWSKLPKEEVHFYDTTRVLSWRWQVKDGGYNFQKRKHFEPGKGTVIEPEHSVYVFHGNPKPHEVEDVAIREHWL